MRRLILIVLVLLAVCGAIYLYTLDNQNPNYKSFKAVAPGNPAPDFQLEDNHGNLVSLSALRGKVVMVNFWATWCGPCRQEMPLLDELYSRYGRVGFSLLGVNIDDNSSKAMDMVSELGVTFPVLFDSRKEVSKLYEVDAMPVTVLIDREGTVRYVHHGYKPGYEEKYLDQIRSLLRE